MGIVKGFTKVIADPFEEGHLVTIRMLSYLELQEARDARVAKLAGVARDIAGLLPERTQQSADRARAALVANPIEQFDIETLLRLGVVAWDYGIDVDPKLFDERTAMFFAREILRYSNPEDDDLGKGSSSSTAISAAAGRPQSNGR